MEITKILEYLTDISVFKKILSFEEITLGKGGAKIFKINTETKSYILKSVHKDYGLDKECVDSYFKEMIFYELNRGFKLPVVINAAYTENSPEFGLITVTDCYKALKPIEWTFELQMQAADLCAKLNSTPLEDINSLGLKWNPTVINESFTKNSHKTWLNVLDEHEGKLNKEALNVIRKNLSKAAEVLNTPPHYLCHGDFHPENILTDGEKLYACDFQGLNIGKCAGDINFFISRASGMNIKTDPEFLFDYYLQRLSEYTGREIKAETLKKELSASSLLVTFSFWADYLHNADFEKVKFHYDEMINAAEILNII